MRTTLAVVILFVLVGSADAGYLEFAWNPNSEPDVAGYRVYYGTASREYSNSIDVGNITAYRLSGLRDDVRYYIAVTAYDRAGNESGFCEEVSAVSFPELQKAEEQTSLSPSSLCATKEEITRFFAGYIDSYNQKDIDGLLSRFSVHAVQNGTEGLDGIKRIYSELFDQSRELRYHLEDMRVEVYQNAAEAEARYFLEQTLKKEGKRKTWDGNAHWILFEENGSLKTRHLNYEQPQSR